MPERVVTLPPMIQGAAALEFADRARLGGASLLELRTDLHGAEAVEARALARVLPLLVSLRGTAAPREWIAAAAWIDVPLELPIPERPSHVRLLRSMHSAAPMSTSEALGSWDRVSIEGTGGIKHVEPIGPPSEGARLMETQRELLRKFGGERVTVLGMGSLALPFRAVLAERNAFDYLALDSAWLAAAGQRLLADATRCSRASAPTPRLGILGTRIAHSRSPRIHPQPFDRIDLPEDAPVGELVDALRPFYRGFAITAPFKRVLAQHVRAELPAINTLVRTESGWRGANTDVAGAAAALDALGAPELVVLGDGGVADALRIAAKPRSARLHVLRRQQATSRVSTPALWTWPPHVAAPASLTFAGQPVAVVAYGAAARSVAHEIVRRGGQPLLLGRRWFIEQARAQRELWRMAA